MWWEHTAHHAPFFPYCFLFVLLFIGLIIFAITSFRRNRCSGGNINQILKAERILKQRLAAGEITEEEYKRLKETLSK